MAIFKKKQTDDFEFDFSFEQEPETRGGLIQKIRESIKTPEEKFQRGQELQERVRRGEKGFTLQKIAQARDAFGSLVERGKEKVQEFQELPKEEKQQRIKSFTKKARKSLRELSFKDITRATKDLATFVGKEVFARPVGIAGLTLLEENRKQREKLGMPGIPETAFERGLDVIFKDDEPRSIQKIFSDAQKTLEKSGVATGFEKFALPLVAVGGTIFFESPLDFGVGGVKGVTKEVLEELAAKKGDDVTKILTNTFKDADQEWVDATAKLVSEEETPEGVLEVLTGKKTGTAGETTVDDIVDEINESIETTPTTREGKLQRVREEIEPVAQRARLRRLDEEVKAADEQIQKYETALQKAANTGRPTKAIENNLNRAIKKRDLLDEERGSLLTRVGGEVTDATKKLTTTPRELATVAKKAETKGIKEGLQQGQEKMFAKLEDAQNARQSIFDFAKKHLPTSEQGKVARLIKDAKTDKDVIKAAARVSNLAEDAAKKDTIASIKKTLKKSIDSPSVAIEYKDKIKEIAADVTFTKPTEKTRKRLSDTRAFLYKQAAEGKEVDIPMNIVNRLAVLSQTPANEMPLSVLENMLADIERLTQLGRTKLRTKERTFALQAENAAEELAQQITPLAKTAEIIRAPGETLSPGQVIKNFMIKAMNKARSLDKGLLPTDVLFDMMDGAKGNYNGPLYKAIKGPIDSGFNAYRNLSSSNTVPIAARAKELKMTDKNFERIAVAAYREQAGGVEKLLDTGLTKKQVDDIKLTAPEQEMLDMMRNKMDELYPTLREISRKYYNKELPKVKNYFPFISDWKAYDDSDILERFTKADWTPQQRKVKLGALQERTGGKQKLLLNAYQVFSKHIDDASYMISLGRDIQFASKVINDPKFIEAAGDIGSVLLREWADLIARKGGVGQGNAIPAIDFLRRKTTVGVLGLKLSTVLIQPTAFLEGIGEIGPTWASKGAANFMANPKWRNLVRQMPEVLERAGGESALKELEKGDVLDQIAKKGMAPITWSDRITASGIAAGAYEKKMTELGLPIDFDKINQEALEYAQLVVRRTQASAEFKDVPLAVSKGVITNNRSVDKAILQFQNFVLNSWSRLRYDAMQAGLMGENKKKGAQIIFWTAASILAAIGMREASDTAVDFITGREREKKPLGNRLFFEATSRIPFLPTILSMIIYGGEPLPLLQPLGEAFKGVNQALSAKTPESRAKGLSRFIGSIGTTAGVPGSVQAQQLIRGALSKPKSKSDFDFDFDFGDIDTDFDFDFEF